MANQIARFKPLNQFPADESLSPAARQALDAIIGQVNQLVGFANALQGTGLQVFGSNIISPTSAQISSAGSRMGSITTAIKAVAATDHIKFFWDGTNGSVPFTIYRDDNSITGPVVAGSPFLVSGLSAGTGYFFYSYWDELLQQISFVNLPGVSVGSPAVAFGAQNALAAQQQFLRSRIPLALLFATTGVTTPSAGTTNVSGGSGGGGVGGGFGGRGTQ